MIYSLADSMDLNGISFHCGNRYIDAYFASNKILCDNDAVTYCFWADNSKKTLVGIASLSCSGIIIESHQQFHIVPAIEIKVFAVDEQYQHVQFPEDEGESDEFRNWSDYCLLYLMEIVDHIRAQCGASHLVLYSVPSAVGFYGRHHFSRFVEAMAQPSNFEVDECVPMFLNLSQ